MSVFTFSYAFHYYCVGHIAGEGEQDAKPFEPRFKL